MATLKCPHCKSVRCTVRGRDKATCKRCDSFFSFTRQKNKFICTLITQGEVKKDPDVPEGYALYGVKKFTGEYEYSAGRTYVEAIEALGWKVDEVKRTIPLYVNVKKPKMYLDPVPEVKVKKQEKSTEPVIEEPKKESKPKTEVKQGLVLKRGRKKKKGRKKK